MNPNNDEVERYEKDLEYYTKLKEKSSDLSAEEAFNLTKESAWDLWSAAPKIAQTCLRNLKITSKTGHGMIKIIDHPTTYQTGLYCWLLWDAGVIQNKDASAVFGGFDT